MLGGGGPDPEVRASGSEKCCSILSSKPDRLAQKPGFSPAAVLTTFTVFHMLAGQQALMTSIQTNFHETNVREFDFTTVNIKGKVVAMAISRR